MSIYNHYVGGFECPFCAGQVSWAQTRFGRLELRDYAPGDRVVWNPRKAVQNGGRPPEGDLRAAVWASCPDCDRPLFAILTVRRDVVEGIEEGSPRALEPTDFGDKFVGFTADGTRVSKGIPPG